MRAWDELARRPGPDPDELDAETAETLAEIEAAGIDLDPLATATGGAPPAGPPAGGDAADQPATHPEAVAHAHPHQRPAGDVGPSIGIVGAGPVGTALGVAFARAGWPIVAVGSRDEARRERFRSLVGPGVRAFAEAAAVVDEAELVLLAVPDDVLAGLAAELRLYSGQAMVHTSGALGAEVLAPAMAAGTQVGAFHPLVAFTDVERSVAALRGATVAVEGDDDLAALLDRLAASVGATAVRLAPGTKPAYHAAAVLAAGGLVALLDAIAELGRVAGLDEAGSLAVYGRLAEQTLGNARALGIRAALTGPTTRGDAGTLERHLAVLRAHAPGVLPLYVAAAEREIDLALARGAIDGPAAERLRAVLAPAS
jgi:predicted short-subunit dehydrogenase-like oxidoreductase (DUF2520 family)